MGKKKPQETWSLLAVLFATSVILEKSLVSEPGKFSSKIGGPRKFSFNIGKGNWIKLVEQSLMNFFKLLKKRLLKTEMLKCSRSFCYYLLWHICPDNEAMKSLVTARIYLVPSRAPGTWCRPKLLV